MAVGTVFLAIHMLCHLLVGVEGEVARGAVVVAARRAEVAEVSPCPLATRTHGGRGGRSRCRGGNEVGEGGEREVCAGGL